MCTSASKPMPGKIQIPMNGKLMDSVKSRKKKKIVNLLCLLGENKNWKPQICAAMTFDSRQQFSFFLWVCRCRQARWVYIYTLCIYRACCLFSSPRLFLYKHIHLEDHKYGNCNSIIFIVQWYYNLMPAGHVLIRNCAPFTQKNPRRWQIL